MTAKLALAMILLTLTGATASAQVSQSGQAALDPSRGDAGSNPDLQGPAVLKLLSLRPGDRVVDFIAGRFTASLSQKVGPTGKVFAVEPDEVVKVHPQVILIMQGLVSQVPAHNVELVKSIRSPYRQAWPQSD